MGDLIVFLLVMIVLGLAVVGAVQVWNWLSDDEERRDLARRERRAEMEIQSIAHQAQIAILNEAVQRAQSRSSAGQPQPEVIDGQVVASSDDEPTD